MAGCSEVCERPNNSHRLHLHQSTLRKQKEEDVEGRSGFGLDGVFSLLGITHPGEGGDLVGSPGREVSAKNWR